MTPEPARLLEVEELSDIVTLEDKGREILGQFQSIEPDISRSSYRIVMGVRGRCPQTEFTRDYFFLGYINGTTDTLVEPNTSAKARFKEDFTKWTENSYLFAGHVIDHGETNDGSWMLISRAPTYTDLRKKSKHFQ